MITTSKNANSHKCHVHMGTLKQQSMEDLPPSLVLSPLHATNLSFHHSMLPSLHPFLLGNLHEIHRVPPHHLSKLPFHHVLHHGHVVGIGAFRVGRFE